MRTGSVGRSLLPGMHLTPLRVVLAMGVAGAVLAIGIHFGNRVWPVFDPVPSAAFPEAVPTPTGELRINDMPLEVITSTTPLSPEEALQAFVAHFDGIPHGDPVYREGGASRSVSIRDTDGRIHAMVAVANEGGGSSLRRFTLVGDAYMERPEAGDELPHGVPVPPGTDVVFLIQQPDVLGGRYQALCESGLTEGEVRRFIAESLEERGWSPYTSYMVEMARTGQATLAYVRGTRQLTVDLFESGRSPGAVDFRISVLSRPHALEPIPGGAPPH